MSEEATIRRGVRNARYTTVPNHVFEDMRLSMEARWLLGYLLSKPDNWTVIMGDIAKKGACGRDKARRMINELVEQGYAEKDQQRADGRFGKLSLVIFDEPREQREINGQGTGVASLPQTENPSTVNPSTEKPSTGNAALVKTDDLAIPETQIERERGREDRKKIEARGWALLKDWPGFAGMPKEPAMKVWLTLTVDEQDEAERKFKPWLSLLKAQRKSHVPAPSTYFGQKLFRDVAEPVEAKPTAIDAPVFGPVWGAVRLRLLLTSAPVEGPAARGFMADQLARPDETGRRARLTRQATYGWPMVNAMHERALSRKGITVTPELGVRLKPLMVAVKPTDEVWQRWRDFHEAQGWPWIPDPGTHPVVFFPVGGPEGLDQFVQAISDEGSDDDGGTRQQAAE